MKTLHQHLDEYLSCARAANQSRVHLRGLGFCVRRFLRWQQESHGITTADRLTAPHLEAWVRHYASGSTRKGMPRKATTISKQFQCDRVFIQWLGKVGMVPQRMFELIPKVKLPYRLPTGVLTHRQMEKFLGLVDTTNPAGWQFRTMLEFLYTSGVRADELLGLNTISLDLANRTARIMGKGSKERIVPFGETARRYLETYLRSIRPLLLRDPAEAAVWLTREGARIPYYTFRRQLVELSNRAKLPVEVTAHTFRRSFTTELIRGGANIYHVKELLGHESLETLKAYTKLTIVDLKKTHGRCHPREHDRS
ncbi:MAG: tyrosine-type recombinase/integrase [Cephaloticoccus sp.]|nr:tyrosine-type recombinase/integrase [Cephaloticoccus sp.]MCF7761896.1 tyrosine-type recombinase/integrase [Cephaloticoccus sp.]